MQWVTRARPKTDRIACPWLVRRFIDPEAVFVYVPTDRVLAAARQLGGYSFDTRGADFTHEGDKCSFEVLIDRYQLGGDPALAELARIVHDADIATDVDTHPFGAALHAIGQAGLAVEHDDQRLLERGLFVYDALYAWCQRHTAPDAT
jgi:hypothetical protein